MFNFSIDDILKKKLDKLSKKDKVLVKNFRKKVFEIINQTEISIDTYKNLKAPMNEYKRIHLTDKILLLFKVFKKENQIIFFDIVHRDKAYKN